MNSIAEIADQLTKRGKFTLTGHAIPDGDCIGSLLALYMFLKQLQKDVQVVLQDPLPPQYQYLNCADQVKLPEQLSGSLGTVIFLDCSDEQRVGEHLVDKLVENQGTINIDHHATNEFFGDYNYVNPVAAATAEIIYNILQELNANITPEMADALYAGIIMDTGKFLNTNTTAETMKIAGGLLDKGADVDKARIQLFESKLWGEMLVLRQGLQNLEISDDGKYAWIKLTYQEVKDIGGLDLHPEGIINYTRMIKGVEVGVLFRETSPGVVKIGFRSRGKVDVAALAKGFGGGGHKLAAGASRQGNLEEVCNMVIDVVKDVIR
ncbi:MAG: bifunctional oligoribonuclease/PAP phosphatase NrnA [Syntrophomonadaceae bacterium]|nr:bifunctional oligoribonuclease/PAP phosphatase NrnA [Syntrophomonadaceae bacterium]MDD3888651.1 bifunctional oligoribonuclease/PAP phosphatase NrnA [Syntrophomonadaceae bacterium]MDD4548274.1 bifunctional oligoribonuclease/PAP phosphatase NrnA [Syntrophomonadaceae bacterium]